MFEVISPEAIAGLAAVAALVVALLEAGKRLLQATPEQVDRFGPAAGVVLGIVLLVVQLLVTATDTVTGAELYAAILQGTVTGLAATGIYEVGGKQVIRSVAGEP